MVLAAGFLPWSLRFNSRQLHVIFVVERDGTAAGTSVNSFYILCHSSLHHGPILCVQQSQFDVHGFVHHNINLI